MAAGTVALLYDFDVDTAANAAVVAVESNQLGTSFFGWGEDQIKNFTQDYQQNCLTNINHINCYKIIQKWKDKSYQQASFDKKTRQIWEQSVSEFYAPYYKYCNQQCKQMLDYQKLYTTIVFAGDPEGANRHANGFIQGYFGGKYEIVKSTGKYLKEAISGTASFGRTVGTGGNVYGGKNQNTNISSGTINDYENASNRFSKYRADNNLDQRGNFGYLEGNINGQAVDNRMWRSTSLDKAREEIHIFTSTEVTGNNGKTWNRMTDSEYRMLNNLANQLGAKKGHVYPHVTGQLKVVSENPFCTSCQDVIKEFGIMFPNVKLILIDGVKK